MSRRKQPDMESLIETLVEEVQEDDELEVVLTPTHLVSITLKDEPEAGDTVESLKRKVEWLETDRKQLWCALWEIRFGVVGQQTLMAEIRKQEGGQAILDRLEAAIDGTDARTFLRRIES